MYHNSIFFKKMGPLLQTALMYAVTEGEYRVVEILLANNADMTVTNGDGETAMDLAVKRGDDNIVDMLEQEEARRRG